MCVDSSLPVERIDGSWYRSQECNYNPSICKWDDEVGYLSLKDCGVICNADGIKIDKNRIEAINEKLWE